ncbi:HlyD family type I secretion periplasmic adaptor subunit [Plastoroseomonas arctica]|uniref:Membrane fusion protein (MFP) family protein n=1 Tax=Plastoroseomonas arctica TaxID=1509237 RepID=A0AAF1K5P0_9PROT|nr:HlyD family type I secretion periplasmic adaptor subunit [Plastoroseomonas arctica]MBR0656780.1 HlyD family type I secretion periplasmic adaptor subunit [Plastoroseomonas arctica]
MSLVLAPPRLAPLPEPELGAPRLRGVALASLLTLVLGLGGIFAWAILTPLERAVIGTGSLVAEGRRKTVNLMEPGLLRELVVREGDRVAAGQVLLRLDVTQAEAVASQARSAYHGGIARLARLSAEQAGDRALVIPGAALDAARASPTIASFVEAERRLYAARWAAYDGAIAAQRRRVAQAAEQISSLVAQRVAAGTRLRALREELAGVNQLLAAGFATRTRALELRRLEAEALGSLGQYTALEAQAGEQMAQAELDARNLTLNREAEIARDLQETQAAVADAADRLRAAQDVLTRREVLAPEAGIVTDLRFFTAGSSIAAGQPVLDLVPIDSGIVVEARIAPLDIEQVQAGQRVNIRLSAYRQREVPMLTGHLTYVSADRQTDPQGAAFFLVRAVLDTAEMVPGSAAIPPLAAGMPAEVFVLGERRTVLDYLLRPLRDSMRRALRD